MLKKNRTLASGSALFALLFLLAGCAPSSSKQGSSRWPMYDEPSLTLKAEQTEWLTARALERPDIVLAVKGVNDAKSAVIKTHNRHAIDWNCRLLRQNGFTDEEVQFMRAKWEERYLGIVSKPPEEVKE